MIPVPTRTTRRGLSWTQDPKPPSPPAMSVISVVDGRANFFAPGSFHVPGGHFVAAKQPTRRET